MTEIRRALVASAPTRLDFGGGWTDVPPFPQERGGFVCNVAISRRATVRLQDATVLHDANAHAQRDPLVAAALRRMQIRGVEVDITSDFPVGAGLGGSSAAGVALAAALHAWTGDIPDAAALAEWSRAVEVEELGIAGGRQDHYAAACGGALGITFAHDTQSESLSLSDPARRTLERQCLLAYTGESRISATTITAVLDAYRDRVPRVLNALDRMKALAHDMRGALLHGDIDALAALVQEHWVEQRALHPGISTPRIDAIEIAARAAGATGLKALGASGGGCVIVFAPDERRDDVAHAVASYATLLDWQVDDRGAVIEARSW